MEITDSMAATLAKNGVTHFWQVREAQAIKQKDSGKADQGFRGAVTGGAQMNGFIEAFQKLADMAGVPESAVYAKSRFLELPGYFRPTKEWDLLIVLEGVLLAAIETKSQVGPSFGNNFNNRTEEAMGSALDLWTAFREKAYKRTVRPWLGYLFLLEDCPQSQRPFLSESRILRYFPNTATHPMQSGTKSSARSSFSSGITMLPRSSCPSGMKVYSAGIQSPASTLDSIVLPLPSLPT
jgi:hypothetical protein